MISAATLLKSAYELEREQQIAQNNAFLAQLGLLQSKPQEVKEKKAKAKKMAREDGNSEISSDDDDDDSNDDHHGVKDHLQDQEQQHKRNHVSRKKENSNDKRDSHKPESKKKRLKIAKDKQDKLLPARRSRRQQHQSVELQKGLEALDEEKKKSRQALVKLKIEETPQETIDKYNRLLEKHQAAGLKLPPNATYNHTRHRVKTMSEDALERRVRVMERAEGNYAVIKMQMFAEVSILEHYSDIADLAKEALDRLLERPKFKGKNWSQMMDLAKGFKCK